MTRNKSQGFRSGIRDRSFHGVMRYPGVRFRDCLTVVLSIAQKSEENNGSAIVARLFNGALAPIRKIVPLLHSLRYVFLMFLLLYMITYITFSG